MALVVGTTGQAFYRIWDPYCAPTNQSYGDTEEGAGSAQGMQLTKSNYLISADTLRMRRFIKRYSLPLLRL